MKKICFLILMLFGVSTKSHALDFSEACELFYHNASHIANMTIDFENGDSVAVNPNSIMKICLEQDSNNSWMSYPVTNFSLAMIGATTAVAIPCLQFIGGYVYNKWFRGQSAEEKKLSDVHDLLNGGVEFGDDAREGSIAERTLHTAQTVDNIQNVIGNLILDDGRNILEGDNLVVFLARMNQQIQTMGDQIQEMRHPHHE